MSFATCCPACATRFRVVADQLKISDGWVRCGQCGEVFDATQDLVAWSDSAYGPLPAESDVRSPVTAPMAPDPENSTDNTDSEDTEDNSNTEDDAAVDVLMSYPSTEAASDVALEFPPADADEAPSNDVPSNDATGDDATDEDVPDRDVAAEAPPADEGWPPSPPLLAGAAADDAPLLPESVGFVRQAQRRAWWQRTGVRWTLALLSVVLGLALLLQWVLFERDRIAALRPDFKPALERLCQPLGCQVRPLRWIDALSIDSTTLARRGNGRYVLEVVLRNASVFELAMPALELSVTDVRDQLLARRVILPAEMPMPNNKVPPQGVMTLRLDVAIDGSLSDALAGYRTLVFYP